MQEEEAATPDTKLVILGLPWATTYVRGHPGGPRTHPRGARPIRLTPPSATSDDGASG